MIVKSKSYFWIKKYLSDYTIQNVILKCIMNYTIHNIFMDSKLPSELYYPN